MPSDPGTPQTQAASASALHSSLTRLQEDLRRADDSLTHLLGRWGPEHAAGQDQFMEFIDERRVQAQRLYELEYGARTSLLVFQSGANTVAPVPTTLPGDEEPAEPEPPRRKDGNPTASYRVVVDRDFLAEPEALRALDERLAAGHQVRVVDQPLIKLAVADGETAMVQVESCRSMMLRPPLVALATELFEAVWRRSRPYLREDGDLSPTDRRILQLMLSGLTDAATAHQLGTSSRTIQRRVRALMDLAAVDSRVQLGWYAMRNNWV
ncbi:helix-turn-helix transcriptional regulator [Streptomyces sp. NPDC058545]|uniref:helix-turn-helix transcriptional regulator n=1 Tax=Streptomyces sp. NPDC058545 TaxID=3346544 RepID=UPI00364F7260